MKFLIIILIVIVLGIGGWFLQKKDHNASINQGMMKMSEDMHSSMGHNQHTMMVKDDKTFIEEMIPHHEEAVKSSQEMLQIAKTPEVKELAQNIVTNQEKEITQMKNWYKEWFGQEYRATGSYTPMMQSVSGKDPEDAEQSYLSDMIIHHQAAVTMAKTIQPITKRDELKTVSNDIISTQNEEITLMQTLLKK